MNPPSNPQRIENHHRHAAVASDLLCFVEVKHGQNGDIADHYGQTHQEKRAQPLWRNDSIKNAKRRIKENAQLGGDRHAPVQIVFSIELTTEIG